VLSISDQTDSTVASVSSAGTLQNMFAKLSGNRVCATTHQKIYEFINDANIPSTIVTNKSFNDLLAHCIESAPVLRELQKKRQWSMGIHWFNTVQQASFHNMFQTIELLLDDAKRFYRGVTKHQVPFLYIGHDIWDGKKKSILGLCLFFISPVLKELVTVPIGILRSRGKSAIEVSEQSVDALKR
jgi:hypothetical protein